jgi:ParB family chromosome partitioning protein
MAKRNIETGLGRGLSAILGDAALQDQENNSLVLPISQVEASLKQPRKRFDDDTLAELAESIRQHGIIQPLIVRRLNSGYYQIISGERRWRAARLAGLDEVPVILIEADDRKAMELGLIENLQREDLNPMEEAQGFETLIQEHGMTQEEVAQRVGKSRSAVANALRLLNLPENLKPLVEDGKLSSGHARALLPLKDTELQGQLAQRIIDEDLSVRQVEALVKQLMLPEVPKKQAQESPLAIYLADVEKNLSARFGRKVKIISGRKKGKVELEYYNSDDLDLLLQALDQLQLAKGGNNG